MTTSDPAKNYLLDQDTFTTYRVFNWTKETETHVGFLTECAWREENYNVATILFLSALFSANSEAVAMRGFLASRDSVRVTLPRETNQGFDYRANRYLNAVVPHRYEVKYLAGVGMQYHILRVDEGLWQLVFCYDTARSTATENETILLLPRSLSPAARRARIYQYLNARLYVPFLEDWTETIWAFCRENSMVRPCLTLGGVEVWQVALRPRLIREYIQRELQRHALPLPILSTSLAERSWVRHR